MSFYDELRNKANYDTSGAAQADWGLINQDPFTNLRPSVTCPRNSAFYQLSWRLYFSDGSQAADYKFRAVYAMVVRTGDVTCDVVAVPEPATAWLPGSGLLSLIWLRQRAR